MKKILFVSLIIVLLLFVACKKQEPMEKEEKQAPAPKIELKDCGKDFACFKDNLLKGNKAKVLLSDVDAQTNSATKLLFESRGKSNNYTVASQKVELIELKSSDEEEKSFNAEQKACYQVVKKESMPVMKNMEGKEMECKLDSSQLSTINDEKGLNELFNVALGESFEQPDIDLTKFSSQEEMANAFLNLKINLKPNGLCKGKLAEYMANIISVMLNAAKKSAESPQCAPIVARGESLPGMVSSTGPTGP